MSRLPSRARASATCWWDRRASAAIQAALNAAEPGDNVRLAAGSYAGTVNYSDAGLTVIAQTGAQQNVTYLGTSGITVYGANLADTITTSGGHDIIDGGGGNDVMTGGDDVDFYMVDSAGDQAIEVAGQGYDVVFSRVDYVLAAGTFVEALSTYTWEATTAIDLTGNEIANALYGNAGNNILDGAGRR